MRTTSSAPAVAALGKAQREAAMLQAIVDWLGISVALHDAEGHVIASSNRGRSTITASTLVAERAPGTVEDCRATHGLSAAEAHVARDLVAGLPPKAIARAEGIKLSTVRTHLRHIFWKTDTANQAELVTLLLAWQPRVK